jgi:hypothetical protein
MLHRRQMLRAAGVALALPLLEANTPAMSRSLRAGTATAPPKRMLAICNNLGLLPEKFFPSEAGRNYRLSPYLQELADHREAFTVFSGVSHPSVDGSHSSDVSFLTAAPHPASGGFRNTISLDQFVASKVGNQTRYPSLTLGVNVKESRRSLSWTAGGVLIPCENSASTIFSKLFLQGTEREIENQIRRLQLGQSIMDTLAEQARALDRRLGSQDRARMDQFVTAVRDVEQRMVEGQQWERTAKPAAPSEAPTDPADPVQYMQKTRLMYRMARLAFDTDSTRAITLLLDSNNSPTIQVDGAQIEDGYHNLSHHGRNEKKLAQLEAIDRAHLRLLAELLTDLKSSQTAAGTLLDHTLILFGSNFGDANKHTTDNMPILLAGGDFRHGQHLMFDQQKNYPLPNLFVSILQQMGVESDRFASSTGTMRGL